VLVDGEAAIYVERGGSAIQALPAADDPAIAALAVRALRDLAMDGRQREVVVTKVDGAPIADSSLRQSFLDAGFVPGYRGLVLRSPAAERNRSGGDRPGWPARDETTTGSGRTTRGTPSYAGATAGGSDRDRGLRRAGRDRLT
jgi:hypothetical protein